MIYTYDDLLAIVDSPVPRDKWGSNTIRILNIIHFIKSAHCSPCMLKRKVSELNTLMAPYGDRVGPEKGQNSHIVTENGRIPCPDCVSKHLSQAFVLQNEFYQGYTENLPLIEAHLAEALEECPKNDEILKNVIKMAQKSVEVDKMPKIPIILCMEQIEAYVNSENAQNRPKLPKIEDITGEISKIPPHNAKNVSRLIKTLQKLPVSPSMLDKAEWSGRLACISDFIVPYAMVAARCIRSIRLYTSKLGYTPEDIDEFYNWIMGILPYIEDIKENTENTPKNA